MGSLGRRVVVLEGRTALTGFDHLTDEEVTTRLVAICETLEREWDAMPDGWRDMIAAGDFRKLVATCEI